MLTKIEFAEKINFVKIKLWLIIVIIQAGSFAMGMYTAHTYWRDNPSEALAKLDYSTDKANEQKLAGNTPTSATTPTKNTPANSSSDTTASNSTSLDLANCTGIKGNISGTNKIYHVSGGSFYDRTTPEMCFATELEAQAAGFIKSSR